jgi:2'-5' RNA ligase
MASRWDHAARRSLSSRRTDHPGRSGTGARAHPSESYVCSCLDPRLADVHATVFLDPRLAARIDEMRAEWDPIMTSQIGPHVTVTYPDEVPTIELMSERVAAAARQTAPFRLGLGSVRCFGRPDCGIYVEVDDLEGGWRSLREAVGSVSVPLAVEPHVTLVHPRTSNEATAAWAVLGGRAIGGETTVDEVVVTAFDGSRWASLSSFRLRDRNGTSRAG